MTAFIGNEDLRKIALSGGAGNGRRIPVAVTASPGTVIHTGPSDPEQGDELWIDAHNTSDVPVDLTIEYGDTDVPGDTVIVTVQPKAAPALVIPGGVLAGAAEPLVIRAFAAVANVITLGGCVHRYK